MSEAINEFSTQKAVILDPVEHTCLFRALDEGNSECLDLENLLNSVRHGTVGEDTLFSVCNIIRLAVISIRDHISDAWDVVSEAKEAQEEGAKGTKGAKGNA